jgi:hypothetical protein
MSTTAVISTLSRTSFIRAACDLAIPPHPMIPTRILDFMFVATVAHFFNST